MGLEESVRYLATLRADLDKLEAEVKDREAELTASLEWQDRAEAMARRDQMRKVVGDVTLNVRAEAVGAYGIFQDKHPHPAITIKVSQAAKYDPGQALDYCIKNLPAALDLNADRFEAAAKSLNLPLVKWVEVATATIARDLSAYQAEG